MFRITGARLARAISRAVLPGLGLLTLGCAHALEVTNLDAYRTTTIASLPHKVSIGIVESVPDATTQRLVKGIGNELLKYSTQVILPYTPSSPQQPVDVVAHISIVPTYKGSGWNFLINWPGFLVFAPAWHGYDYEADYDISGTIMNGTDDGEICSFSLPIHLDVRHAAINRTWTEISWLEYGAIAFIGGLVFIRYDAGVTPQLVDAVADPLGDRIAQEIVTKLNASGRFGWIRRLDGAGQQGRERARSDPWSSGS